ncbi:MAG: nucleotidyl transferase AbiEii/AbiGii toxin family protein [Pseudonocardiaceae bacterium]
MDEPTDRAPSTGTEGLTLFQIQVAQLFFSLPASNGFLLAGGAALVAQHLTTRGTQDLDFFTGPGRGDVPTARDAFEVAAMAKGWAVHRVRDTATFCRLVITGVEALLVDLALDTPPNSPAIVSMAGPTFGLEELAGRKVIALFDRAEARDFADVFILAQRYTKLLLLTRAAEIDGGFDLAIFADMLDTLSRFTDAEIPVRQAEVNSLRQYFTQWAIELRS